MDDAPLAFVPDRVDSLLNRLIIEGQDFAKTIQRESSDLKREQWRSIFVSRDGRDNYFVVVFVGLSPLFLGFGRSMDTGGGRSWALLARVDAIIVVWFIGGIMQSWLGNGLQANPCSGLCDKMSGR